MKKLILLLLTAVCFLNCKEEKKTLEFVALNPNEFNTKLYEIPSGNLTDSLKQAHDSCMGFSFNANVFLAQKHDFFIGSIINKRSLQVVNTINNLGLTQSQVTSKFNLLTNPCYETHVLQIPLRTILGENFMLQLPDINEKLNKEINDAITASDNAEMKTGSWIYLDMKNVLRSTMDTAKSIEGLKYKNDLLDTSNIVLTSVESVADINFMINTKKEISIPLQALLKNKPSVPSPDGRSSIQLFYVDTNKFKLTLNGFFPVVGEFTKAELQ